jgi:hypothetical protein
MNCCQTVLENPLVNTEKQAWNAVLLYLVTSLPFLRAAKLTQILHSFFSFREELCLVEIGAHGLA